MGAQPAAHSKHTPVHVTLRVVKAVGGLRRRRAYHAVRRALNKSFDRGTFRITHLSIQRTHIHLICEADDATALTRGLQGFQIAKNKMNYGDKNDRDWNWAQTQLNFGKDVEDVKARLLIEFNALDQEGRVPGRSPADLKEIRALLGPWHEKDKAEREQRRPQKS